MAKIEQHMQDALAAFGQTFEPVHRWLDEFAGTEGYRMRHRRKRHHLAGIQEAGRLFGDGAAAAAEQHVVRDLQEEGWAAADPMPKDEADYQRMGLF